LVSIPELNTKVRRTFADFQWFRDKLIEFYPGCLIPPLPKKNIIERVPEELVYFRMRLMDKFLNSLMSDQLIKSSILVDDFLTISDNSEFQKIKNKYSKTQGPLILKDYFTQTGKIEINVSQEKDLKAQKIIKTAIGNEFLFKKLNHSLKLLMGELLVVSDRFMEISGLFSQLHQMSCSTEFAEESTKVYHTLSKLISNMSNSYHDQVQMFELDFKEFFSYCKYEMKNFKNVKYYKIYIL
jgi:hypothetical protein